MGLLSLFRKNDYKNIDILSDPDENLFLVPYGHSKKYGMSGLDIINILSAPYTDEELERIIFNTFNQCNSRMADDTRERTKLEEYLNVKGYAKAVKNKKCIGLSWSKEDGYVITPTEGKRKNGFIHMETIKLGHKLEKNELAQSIKMAIAISKAYM